MNKIEKTAIINEVNCDENYAHLACKIVCTFIFETNHVINVDS